MIGLRAALALAATLALSGCSILVDFDRSRIPEADAGDAGEGDAGEDAG